MEHADSITQLMRDRKIIGENEQGEPIFLAEESDAVAELGPLHGVEAIRDPLADQEFRSRQKCPGQGDLLPLDGIELGGKELLNRLWQTTGDHHGIDEAGTLVARSAARPNRKHLPKRLTHREGGRKLPEGIRKDCLNPLPHRTKTLGIKADQRDPGKGDRSRRDRTDFYQGGGKCEERLAVFADKRERAALLQSKRKVREEDSVAPASGHKPIRTGAHQAQSLDHEEVEGTKGARR